MSPGISEDVREVTDKLITTLPPAMTWVLMVILILNLALFWIMHDLSITRIEAVTKIFTACTVALTAK